MAPQLLFVLLASLLFNVYSETITCDGGIQSNDCAGQTKTCTSNDLCTIRCKLNLANATQYGVCVNSVINCKKGQHCLIRCDSGIAGCRNIIINAQNATKLDIISENSNSFDGSQIYCPLNGNCNFIANPIDIDAAFHGMTILSQVGFNANLIDIQCNKLNCLQNARLNCTSDYSQSCLIDNHPLNGHSICINGNDCGISLDPTLEPTVNPTTNPTAPTLEPTNKPVMLARELTCDAWEIQITFMLLQYSQTDNNWKQKLKTLCLNGFIETILLEINKWNMEYCCVVNEWILNIMPNTHTTDNIYVNVTFIISNELYLDYFMTYTNITTFGIKFRNYLLNELGNDFIKIKKLNVHKPIYIYTLQTESAHDNRHHIIIVSSVIIIVLCCAISIYTIVKCWTYELTVDETEYNIDINNIKTQQTQTQSQTQTQPIVQKQLQNKKNSSQRISEILSPIKLRLNNIASGRTSKVAMHITKELEMLPHVTKITQLQSQSPENSVNKTTHQPHTQTQTLSDCKPGLLKMDTAQQELELNAIFEEMMIDNIEKNDDSQSDS